MKTQLNNTLKTHLNIALMSATYCLSLLISPLALAETAYKEPDIGAIQARLKAAASKVTKEVFSTQVVKVVVPSHASTSYLSHKRALDGKLKIKEFTDKDIYWFEYPEVCDVETSGANNTIKFRCPNTHGFAKFIAWFESGYPSEKIDDITTTFSADNNWHEMKVTHPPYYSNRIWTNVKITPLF